MRSRYAQNARGYALRVRPTSNTEIALFAKMIFVECKGLTGQNKMVYGRLFARE